MAKIYGLLEKAQLEVITTSLLTTDPEGRIAWNSITEQIEIVNNGTEVQNVVTQAVTGSSASPQNITAAGGIAFVNKNQMNVWFIQGSGGAVTISANPQIAAGGFVGQRLILIGRSDSNTVTLNDGTGLSLNGTCVFGANQILELIWDSVTWTEVGRSF